MKKGKKKFVKKKSHSYILYLSKCVQFYVLRTPIDFPFFDMFEDGKWVRKLNLGKFGNFIRKKRGIWN